MAWSKKEFLDKLEKLRNVMNDHDMDCLLIQKEANFAWLTGGRGYVSLGAEKSRAEMLITHDQVMLITNNIEVSRLISEELNGLPIEAKVFNWWEKPAQQELGVNLSGRNRFMTDADLGISIDQMRWQLSNEEIDTYRKYGEMAADAVAEVCCRIKPDDTEFNAAGKLAAACIMRELTPCVLLVGSDERVFSWRHPLPTTKRIDKYVLIVLGSYIKGLHISCSRLVHFGTPTDKIKILHDAVCQVDACYRHHTLPGRKLGEIFNRGVSAYEAAGYPAEWKKHHQGGLTGYASREILANPSSQQKVKARQAYAWNPSITGVKSEDTFLVMEYQNEVITRTNSFPHKKVIVEDQSLYIPDILVRCIYY
ncbi:MAG: M24 family metallopeptidase [Bacillota bacterium]